MSAAALSQVTLSPLTTVTRGRSPVTVTSTATSSATCRSPATVGQGDVYIAGMDEGGGGFPHNDTNHIFKSTDGGNTWANTYTGTPFPGPGVRASAATVFRRHVYLTRLATGGTKAGVSLPHLTTLFTWSMPSTALAATRATSITSALRDGGVTFGAPFKLNTDSTTRPQWQPNLSVSPSGTLLATWYDARESTSCTPIGNPASPCYRMWSRKSNDNGVTWLPDDTFSDVVSPCQHKATRTS